MCEKYIINVYKLLPEIFDILNGPNINKYGKKPTKSFTFYHNILIKWLITYKIINLSIPFMICRYCLYYTLVLLTFISFNSLMTLLVSLKFQMGWIGNLLVYKILAIYLISTQFINVSLL